MKKETEMGKQLKKKKHALTRLLEWIAKGQKRAAQKGDTCLS